MFEGAILDGAVFGLHQIKDYAMQIHKYITAACTRLHTDFPESHFIIVAISKNQNNDLQWNLHASLPSTDIPPLVEQLSKLLVERYAISNVATLGSA